MQRFKSRGVIRRGVPAPWASMAKFSGEQRPELQNPPHRLVGDIQTALREQIFDVAIAKRETHIEPDAVLDDRRWNWWRANEKSYPANREALPLP